MYALWNTLGLDEPNMRWVLFGTAFLSAVSAWVGTFTYLQKKSLLGDAIAHGILPGVAGSFLLSGQKNAAYIMIGALVWGFLTVLAIEWITRKSHLKPSTAMAIVLSAFFGLGMMLLTQIQNSGLPDASGLQSFLFGQAASLLPSDILVYSIFALVALIVLLALYRSLTFVSFDKAGAQSMGFSPQTSGTVLSILVVIATAIGIQSIGLILMAALLITPAAIARMWSQRLWTMLMLAGGIAAVSAISGSLISFSGKSMPTGPWIVMVLFFIFGFSVLFSTHRGLVQRAFQKRKNRQIIQRENLLKALYHLREQKGEQAEFTFEEIQKKRMFSENDLQRILGMLKRKKWVLQGKNGWTLSGEGLNEGRRITRLHRLWELYLSQKMRLKEDHIHPIAESMEHIITEDLEAQLLHELDYPELDPHQKRIPYDTPAKS
ncbi:MAG: metal ABC transporter permease [Cryomorphaceae bacterium]|nr:metal ABC transporter permease [Cryomorphaceae bacterium]